MVVAVAVAVAVVMVVVVVVVAVKEAVVEGSMGTRSSTRVRVEGGQVVGYLDG